MVSSPAPVTIFDFVKERCQPLSKDKPVIALLREVFGSNFTLEHTTHPDYAGNLSSGVKLIFPGEGGDTCAYGISLGAMDMAHPQESIDTTIDNAVRNALRTLGAKVEYEDSILVAPVPPKAAGTPVAKKAAKPADEEEEEEEVDDDLRCEDCGKAIKAWKTNAGKTISAKQQKEMSINARGRPLCRACDYALWKEEQGNGRGGGGYKKNNYKKY